jgi:histidinol-phosphate aminotransferase
MQTLSKAWGLAALRLGICFASLDIIDIFNKVKPPYNINEASQELALEALQNTELVNNWIKTVVHQKEILIDGLQQLPFVKTIYPTDANFLLVKLTDADALYNYLAAKEIVVRNRTKEVLCDNCLRITIGTPQENEKLLLILKKYQS